MLTGFLKYWLKPKSIIALEIHKDESGMLLHSCKVTLRGKYLKLEQIQVDMKNMVHFSKHFKSTAITLCLTGKWVVTKETKAFSLLNQQLVNTVFPNASIQHFYFQQANIGTRNYLSMIRKDEVEVLLGQLSLLGFDVLVISLDSLMTDTVITPPAAEFDEKLLPAYASAFQLLLKKELIAIDNENLLKSRRNFFAKARVLGISSLAAALLLPLLLLNLLIYNHYSSLGQTVANQTSLNVAEVDKFQQQEARIVKRVAMIKSVGWTGGLKFAYLVDRIVESMPYGIRLKEISVNPIVELNRIGQSGSDTTSNKTVSVIGLCKEAGMVNNWIFALKANPWLKDCQILNYTVRQEDQQADFALNISLKDHEE